MSNWISVKDRLPKPWDTVLCYRNSRLFVGWFGNSNGWFKDGYESTTTPTHWQPLPEPPEST